MTANPDLAVSEYIRAPTPYGARPIAQSTIFIETRWIPSKTSMRALALALHLREGHAEEDREDHEGQHLALERVDRRGERVARDQREQRVRPGLGLARVLDGLLRLRCERALEVGADGRIDPDARLEEVDEEDAHRHRDPAREERVDERLQAHAAQPVDVAELEHAEDQRREDERHDDHEDEAQKELPERVGDVLDAPVDPGSAAADGVGEQSQDDPEEEAEEDLAVPREALAVPAGRLRGRVCRGRLGRLPRGACFLSVIAS